MTRLSVSTVALGGALFVSVAALSTMTLTPASYDLGRLPLNTARFGTLRLSGGPTKTGTQTSIPKVSVTGPNAAEFTVVTGRSPNGNLLSSCLGLTYFLVGVCDYLVVFKPTSVGIKTAQLVVNANLQTATATLTGEGIVSCRPYLVSCNYAQNYSGTFNIHTSSSTNPGSGGIAGSWDMTVDVTIVNGEASCIVTQNDWEDEYNGSTIAQHSTMKGVITAPGLFAIEFSQSRGTAIMEYTLHFDCPSPDQTTTYINYLDGTSGSGNVPGEPADWRHAHLVADPRPATQIGMVNLVGKQTDLLLPAANNGAGGTTTIFWSLTRS